MATRVYIGRLARDARERDVEKLFRNYGTIREIKLMNGFGFVEFRDHRDADDVVYAFNGKSFMGEKLIVEYARGERRRRDRDDRRDRDRDDRRDRDRDRDDRRRDDRDRDRGSRFAPPQRNPQYRLIVENLSSSCSWQIDIVLALVVALLFLWLLDVAFGFCLPFRLMATLLKICLDYILLYIPQKVSNGTKAFRKNCMGKKGQKTKGTRLHFLFLMPGRKRVEEPILIFDTSRSDSFGPIIWITIYFYSWDLPALVPSIGIGTWHMEITQEPMRIVEAYRPFTITQSKPPSPTPLPF
ncbi:RNA-binding domain-containing protein [Gigaspora margarita]|uniref:RNA-binding domain-containing protein n=1 Tax=Gigaspora margarita TaxID=4874 RepID=A0A8H4EUG4_GIGMA|nr:RNA-binding domain-containing protein [Gigaspora margarita]